jgi:hypothetical protein
LTTHYLLPMCSLAGSGWRLLCALTMALAISVFAPIADNASAKAPPLATIVLDAQGLRAPDFCAAPVAMIPQGAEVKLTGEAKPGFLAVYYDGQAVWVPAQYLSIGVRPGIDTGVGTAGTRLLDAPVRDATVLESILEGQGVILAGANVDGYDAASHQGTGGWIDERDLSR